jgi:hypothetical protein
VVKKKHKKLLDITIKSVSAGPKIARSNRCLTEVINNYTSEVHLEVHVLVPGDVAPSFA